MDRDEIRSMMQEVPAEEGAPELGDDFGSPTSMITTRVDVAEWTGLKRTAMRAHASQIPPESFFLAMPDDVFARAFGTEWFIRRGAPSSLREDDLFAGITPT
jgi:LmbE family N-acetylglucosaminyl deacetylase